MNKPPGVAVTTAASSPTTSAAPPTLSSATSAPAIAPASAAAASPQVKPVNLSTGGGVAEASGTPALTPAAGIVVAPATTPPATTVTTTASTLCAAATAIRIPKVIAPQAAAAVSVPSATIVRTPVAAKPLTIPQPVKTPLQIPQPPTASHRLPPPAATFTQMRTQPAVVSGASTGPTAAVVVNKHSPGLAVLQHGVPEGAKLTVVHGATSASSTAGTTTIRPLNPVTIRAPGVKGPQVAGTAGGPVHLVPLTSPRGATAVQQTSPVRQHTAVQFKANDPAAAVAAAAAVRVTLIQTSTSIKSTTAATSNFYGKPVTITTQPRSQINPPPGGSTAGAAQPVRIGINQSRMTVIPSGQFGQQVNVTLNPMATAAGSNPVPLNATPARILTQSAAGVSSPSGTTTRLISVPMSSTGSTVSIQKGSSATATTVPVGTKTISLPPYIPKNPTGNLPVARVIPQPLTTEAATTASLFIARPQLHITSAEGGAPVVLSTTSSGSTNVLRPGLTIHTATVPQPTSQQQLSTVVTSVVSGTQIAPATVGSPSRPGILRRREGERSGDQQADVLPSGTQIVPTSNLTLSASGMLVPASAVSSAPHAPVLPHTQVLNVPSSIAVSQPVPSPPRRPESGGSSSGSTTLSATSSPPLDDQPANATNAAAAASSSASQPGSAGPSPRKKPRKQAHVNREDDQNWPSGAEENHLKHKVPSSSAVGTNGSHSVSARSNDEKKSSGGADNAVAARKPAMSLLNSYRHTWKSRHNHFLRYTDIKAKEERRPSVNELANQRHVLQKVNGWKIYHLQTQIEDIVEMEKELSTKLNALHKRLEKSAHKDMSRDVSKVQEIIKANLQRSKLIQDQLKESKANTHELFGHKDKVVAIINHYVSKRQIKKREVR